MLFVLIPGAGGSAWYWHRVVPLLLAAGHDAVAVDLPGHDEQAALPEYASLVVDAIANRNEVVLVAQSLGGFTAPLVAAKVPVRAIVLVNAMVPLRAETPGDWWANTGWEPARSAAATQAGYAPDFSISEYFLHDVPPDVAAAGEQYQRPEAEAVFTSICEFDAWPPVPVRVVAGADDRFFPVHFQRTVARQRLGVEASVLPGGHLMALSQPAALADHLLQVADVACAAPHDRGVSVSEATVWLTGPAIGKSLRWHDGFLWLCNWGTQEIMKVDPAGHREVVTRFPTTIPFSIDWLPVSAQWSCRARMRSCCVASLTARW